MRFQVPQFIEVEDKIFGPLTFKQFLYIAGSIGVVVILLVFLPRFIAILLAVPVLVFGGALAFYRVNERSFTDTVESFLHYSFGSKLYVWKKEERKPEAREATPMQANQIYVPKLSESKLKDLAVALDTSTEQQEIPQKQSPDERFKI
ncbi:MAG: seg [Parcubacteria group bacterium]|nr:seg [Parcubacteria group bacterium]